MVHYQKADIVISDAKILEIIYNFDKKYRIEKITSIEEGTANPVFIIATQKTDLVLRVFNPVNGDWKAPKEEAVYDIFKTHKIPCPHILKTDISKKLIKFNYVISKRLDGTSLDKVFSRLSMSSKLRLVKELGKYLGRIHSVRFDKFGDVIKKGNSFVVGPAHELSDVSKGIDAGPFTSWKEMHREIIKARLFFLKGTEFEIFIEPIKKYFKKNEYLLDYKITPRLLHLDLNRYNIFVKNDKITGLLDVEWSLVGHNEYDLMRTELHFRGNPKLRSAFFKEYTKYVNLDDGYEERRSFYSLSRALVGIRSLVLWKSRYTKKEYLEEKKWIRSHIKKILKTNKVEL